MTDNTRLTLTDLIDKAVKTRDPASVTRAENLLRVKCFQERISWLLFLMDEVVPTIRPVETPKTVAVREEVICPYCSERQKNIIALRSHLGIKHKDLKNAWKGKF